MGYNIDMKKVAIILGILGFIGLCLLIPKFKKHDVDVINVNNMPGHKASQLRKNIYKTTQQKPQKSVTRLQNGVYIIKDNSVINQNGINFEDKFVNDIKLKDIQFADENFPF